ncbi:MAG: PAQR family membrane homeostasis protein TrhA [Planctomycetota bacterium]
MDHENRLTLGRMQNPVRGILHGIAAALSAAGAVLLWLRAAPDPNRQIPLLVFALSLVFLYTISGLYHSVPWQQVWKGRMQRLDHAMIYVLVAGTYTPVAMILLDGQLREITLGVVWGFTLVGVLQKAFWPRVGNWFSITLQVFMGWLALLLVIPLANLLPSPAMVLMAIGGLFYTLGSLFLAVKPRLWHRVFSYHEAFHVFVVAGSATHYGMVFWYMTAFPAA